MENILKTLKNEIVYAAKVSSILLITNLSSFSTVAMEKSIANYSKEQAAVVNSLSSIPFVYDIGFGFGHKIFYGDNNYIKTVDKQLPKFCRGIPRPYLDALLEGVK